MLFRLQYENNISIQVSATCDKNQSVRRFSSYVYRRPLVHNNSEANEDVGGGWEGESIYKMKPFRN